MNINRIFTKTFSKKKVLITGHTGFKGSWLTLWLKELGAIVTGISKDIPTTPSNFKAQNLNLEIENYFINIENSKKLNSIIQKKQPDFIFHLAAQSLVRKSYINPTDTWKTNLIGTVNLLESLRYLNKKCIAVIITSDKCYDNLEWEWGYRENDKLGGPDPYSASKGAAEIAISSYARSFFQQKNNNNIFLASARAGNVIGGGDWAEDRIIPDCIKNWSQSKSVKIRNPYSTRPWQHVLEPISGYLQLASMLNKHNQISGRSYNFGPSSDNNYSVQDLVLRMSLYWDNVKWSNDSKSKKDLHESGLLKLNCDRALKELSWSPTLDFDSTVRLTAEWYKIYYENKNKILDITKNQIYEFMEKYKKKID